MTLDLPKPIAAYFTADSAAILEIEQVSRKPMARWLSPSASVSSTVRLRDIRFLTNVRPVGPSVHERTV
jgi:hypothetical protein